MHSEPLTVLVADDDRSARDALRDILERHHYRVETAQDGLDAMAKLRARRYPLVVADLRMPGADGLEVLREAKKLDPDVLVVIVTGYASLETALQAIRSGAYDYLTKPFRLEEMLVVMNNAKERIRLLQENRNLAARVASLQEEVRALRENRPAAEAPASTGGQAGPAEFPGLPAVSAPLHLASGPRRHRDVVSELERLHRLRKEGTLDEQEFAKLKQRLIQEFLE